MKSDIRLAISGCLLGKGTHSHLDPHARAVLDGLAEHVTFVPVPAHEKAAADVGRRLAGLARLHVAGFIYHCNPTPRATPRTMETAVAAHSLFLPVESFDRLLLPPVRQHFIQRAFAYARMRKLFGRNPTRDALAAFHARERMLIEAHSGTAYRILGRLVLRAEARISADVANEYQHVFMAAMNRPSTPERQRTILDAIVGRLRPLCVAEERGELVATLDDFSRGLVPLIVPLTLIRHHAARHRLADLAGQSFLEPHPSELMTQNR